MINSDNDLELQQTYGIFVDRPKKKKNMETKLLNNLMKIPEKDKGANRTRYVNDVKPNMTHQADLLFLTNDNGYKYALVVVDNYTRLCDAEPLKTKTSQSVKTAFENIYKRNILKLPKRIQLDPGSEFKGAAFEFFKSNDVFVTYGKAGRSRMQALVERKNQVIGTAIHRVQLAQEITTGKTSTEWVDDLPKIVKLINSKIKKNYKPPKLDNNLRCEGDSCILLDIGTKVRVALEHPIDFVTGKRLHGKFRSSDIRWNPAERVIKQVLLKPNQPPLYLLDGNFNGIERVAYTKNQLQVIPPNEIKPSANIIRKATSREDDKDAVIESIISREKQKNKYYYQVKYRNRPESENQFIDRQTLIKLVPDMIKEFEGNFKIIPNKNTKK